MIRFHILRIQLSSRDMARVGLACVSWAVLTVGSACSTGWHGPLARSSRPPGSAFLRRAPCSDAYRRVQPPWCSPRAGSVCLLRAPCNAACHLLELPWDSPRAGSAFRPHGRCSAFRLEQQLSSPRAGSACLLRAPRSSRPLYLTSSSSRAGTSACLRHARNSAFRLEQQ